MSLIPCVEAWSVRRAINKPRSLSSQLWQIWQVWQVWQVWQIVKHLLWPCLRAFLKRCKSRFQTTPDETFQQKEMAQSNRICGGWLCNFVRSNSRRITLCAQAVLSNPDSLAERWADWNRQGQTDKAAFVRSQVIVLRESNHRALSLRTKYLLTAITV